MLLLLLAQAGQALGSYQRRFPLRPGMPREELRQRLQVEPAAALSALLEQGVRQGRLALTGGFVAMADHRAEPGPAEQAALARLMTQFAQASANPPTGPQAEEALGAELFQWAVEQGRLIKASEGVLLTGEAYADMERRLVAHLRAQGQATVAEVRDLLSTSRKYALAFLEETDRRRVTKRLGDVRVLRDAPRAAASVE